MDKRELRQLLDTYSNVALTAMCKARGVGKSNASKAVYIQTLVEVLRDKKSVRKVFDSAEIQERLLLALLGAAGGRCTVRELNLAASRSGVGNFDTHFDNLLRRALVLFNSVPQTKHLLWEGTRHKSVYGSDVFGYVVFALPEALELAGSVALPEPANHLESFSGEVGAVHEQSPSVLLHGLFTVARWCGAREVKIAQTTGQVARNDMKALVKQFDGNEEWCEFLIAMGVNVGLWSVKERLLKTGPNTEKFFTQPLQDQLRQLFDAWQHMPGWSEFLRVPEIVVDYLNSTWMSGSSWSSVPSSKQLLAARAFIVGTLRLQGERLKNQDWKSLASLLTIIKTEDVGFLIPRGQRRSYFYSDSRSPDDYVGFHPAGPEGRGNRFSMTRDWELVEGRFIRQVLAEPLTWMGLVCTARDAQGEVAAFRLTPLGLQVLQISTESESAPLESAGLPPGKPLTVQPNFEIIAYTEPEHLPVLFQLERFADRTGADRVAHYRLTRESVHRGAQEGLGAAEMKEFLARHGKGAVPQNVAFSIDDWHRLIELVAIRRSAALIEAESAAELDTLLAKLPEGAATRLGDCWAQVGRAHEVELRELLCNTGSTVEIDYEKNIEQAFVVNESLQLILPRKNCDLLLLAKIEQFADAMPGQGENCVYQFTRDGLTRASQLGVHHSEVLNFLSRYGTLPLPADVALTLRGWAQVFQPVALQESFVLITQDGLIDQLAEVGELRALLSQKISDRAAIIKREHEPALRQALEKRGLIADAKFSERLRPPSAPKPPFPPHPPILPTNRRGALKPPMPVVDVKGISTSTDIPLDYELNAKEIKLMMELAIDNFTCVVIDYQGKLGPYRHKIAPQEMVSYRFHDSVVAWDFSLKTERQFRIDKILGCAKLDEEFDPIDFL